MPTTVKSIRLIRNERTDVTAYGVSGQSGYIPPVHTDLIKVNSLTYSDITSGVSNPKWRDQVRKHQSATTPYSCDRQTRKLAFSALSGVQNTNLPGQTSTVEYTGSNILATFHNPALGSIGSLQSLAYLAFVKHANAEMQAFKSQQFFGELRETIHSIRHPLDALKSGIINYLKACPTVAARRLNRARLRVGRSSGGLGGREAARSSSRRQAISDVISGTYLEYANGWKPLVQDILGASKALASTITSRGVSEDGSIGYSPVTGKASTTLGFSYVPTLSGIYIWAWDVFETESREASYRYKGEVKVQNTGDLSSLASVSAFNLGEFVPTIWELIPLSYVADYFTNIGANLEAFAFNQASVTWLCGTSRLTSKVTSTGVYRVKPNPGGLNGLVSNSGALGVTTATRKSIARTQYSGWTPSLAFTLPGLDHIGDKLANVSSLLAQARSSSRQLNGLLYR